MKAILARLGLGLGLMVLLSVVLLLSDLDQRTSAKSGRPLRVAILQHASTEVLDAGVRGMVKGLADNGYIDGKTVELKRFNAEGDIGVANSVAREVTGGGYDVVLTSSTPSMQAVASANRDGRVKHVFGLVAHAAGAGIGVSRDNPMDKPPHITGLNSMGPVKGSFELAREMNPVLRKVGIVWNAGEANSLAYTIKAREVAKELGIELLEANIENSAGITEAVNSVIARGAQAIWVGGDNAVVMGLDAVLAAARRGHVPVFSILPGKPDRGTLFDLGPDFEEVGRRTGEIAAQVLAGADVSKLPVQDVALVVPRLLQINKTATAGLKEKWIITNDMLDKAHAVVDENGTRRREPKTKD